MIQSKRIFGLDLMRALAILLVLAAHSVEFMIPVGVIGVEIFFVLSGFLVGGIFLRAFSDAKAFTIRHVFLFLKRRWWRTLPNYYLFLLVFGAVAYFSGSLPDAAILIRYPLFLQNLTMTQPEFFSISWSLAIEEWFYLLLPGTVIVTGLLVKNRHTAFAIGCLLMGVTSFVLRMTVFDISPWDTYARKIALGRLDALACGCLIAWLEINKPKLFEMFSRPFSVTFPFILGLVVSFVACANFPGTERWIPSGLIFLLMPVSFALCIPFLVNARLPFPGFIKHLITKTSLWSYSLYLIHIPVILLFHHWVGDDTSKIVRAALRGSALMTCFATAAFVYHFFEVPLMRLRPKENSVV